MKSRPLIMIVDDDDDIRETLRDILDLMQYDVTLAADGLEALAQLKTGTRPDVILLDLMMPVMNGYEFVIQVRKSPTLARIPILVITAAGNAMVEATKIDAAGSIQKPFKAQKLLAVLDSVRPMTS